MRAAVRDLSIVSKADNKERWTATYSQAQSDPLNNIESFADRKFHTDKDDQLIEKIVEE